MRAYLRHAWQRTFSSFGGFGWVYSLFAIPVVGFVLHYLVSGKAAMNAEVQIWLIYGLASAGLVFSTVFFWNLVCAPYRICRDRLLDTQKQLKKIEKPTPDWSLWKHRTHYTVLETAFLLAEQEPTTEPPVGDVLARLQELKWAIQEEKLLIEISDIEKLNHKKARIFDLEPQIRNETKLNRSALMVYLVDHADPKSKRVLANLGEPDLLRLHEGIVKEKKP